MSEVLVCRIASRNLQMLKEIDGMAINSGTRNDYYRSLFFKGEKHDLSLLPYLYVFDSFWLMEWPSHG